MTSNKRIAKNTLMLYIRMFISMLVGLYTSRVVLATLGVEDYGIYGVVGGVVAMMGFLNASMSGATSRFLTFELGKGDKERLAKTFSSALIVHIGIAIVVLILAETVGLWFLSNKLNIPAERMQAAHWVYQLSILSAMFGITQVPYNAAIIAHEKMDVYAYVEILNVSLKLLIVYLLCIGNFDKLILYASLMLAVSILIMMVYRIYAIRQFPEAHFHWIWDKTYLRPLLSFSGWNLYGNFGNVVGTQGTTFVVNAFFGVVMNAAVSVGLTVANVVNQFASNALTAFRPPITKLYAQGDVAEMQNLTMLALKSILFLYSLVAIPVFAECDYLLHLWLVEVPQHSVIFCRILLVNIFFEILRFIIIIDIHASGNVKYVSAFTGTTFVVTPLVVYGCNSINLPPETGYVVFVLINILLGICNVFIAKHYIPQISKRIYFFNILRIVAVCTIALVIVLALNSYMPNHFIRLIFSTILSVSILSTLALTACFNSHQRSALFQFLKAKFHK